MSEFFNIEFDRANLDSIISIKYKDENWVATNVMVTLPPTFTNPRTNLVEKTYWVIENEDAMPFLNFNYNYAYPNLYQEECNVYIQYTVRLLKPNSRLRTAMYSSAISLWDKTDTVPDLSMNAYLEYMSAKGKNSAGGMSII
jgi:hypothetical protein